MEVVDGEQPAAADALAKVAHGVASDRVGERVAEIGGGEVLGARRRRRALANDCTRPRARCVLPVPLGAEDREDRRSACDRRAHRRADVEQAIDGAGDERDSPARRRTTAMRRRAARIDAAASSAGAPQSVRPGRGISVTWSTTSAPSAKMSARAGRKNGDEAEPAVEIRGRLTGAAKHAKIAAEKHSSDNPEILPDSASRAGAVAGEFQPVFVVASRCRLGGYGATASSTSAAVVVAPKLNRNALEIDGLVAAHREVRRRGFAGAAGAGGAGRAGDAGLVERDEQRLPIEADEGDVRRVRQARRRRRR